MSDTNAADDQNVITVDKDKKVIVVQKKKKKLNLPKLNDIQKHSDLSVYISSLYFDEAFFSSIARHINFVMSEDIDTAGVAINGTDISLYWSPNFMQSLTNMQVRGLLKHEFFHLAFSHCTTRALKPHSVFNLAADLAINCGIPAVELPGGCWVPGELHLDIETGQPSTDPEAAKLAELVKSFPKFESTEYYFSELMKSDVVKEMLKNSKTYEISFDGFDDHDMWKDMDPEEAELVKGKIREMIKQSVRSADRTNQWGSTPAEMIGQLRQLVSDEIDWTAVLREFVRKSKRGRVTTTWSNLHMSNLHEDLGPATPGKKQSFTSRVAVYIDESGSMGDEDLELLFAELANFTQRSDFPTYVFDTEVDESSKIDWKPKRGMPKKALDRIRCGGTDFTAPTKHANSGKIKGLDGYLILTDGGASKSPPSAIKRGYVLVPGQKLAFEPDPGDFVIQMTGAKKKL